MVHVIARLASVTRIPGTMVEAGLRPSVRHERPAKPRREAAFMDARRSDAAIKRTSPFRSRAAWPSCAEPDLPLNKVAGLGFAGPIRSTSTRSSRRLPPRTRRSRWKLPARSARLPDGHVRERPRPRPRQRTFKNSGRQAASMNFAPSDPAAGDPRRPFQTRRRVLRGVSRSPAWYAVGGRDTTRRTGSQPRQAKRRRR